MTFAQTTAYIVDVTTADKPDLMDALIVVEGILTVGMVAFTVRTMRTVRYTSRHWMQCGR